MNLAGQDLPNPDAQGGLQIEKHYTTIAVDSQSGIKPYILRRYPNPAYGSSYIYPRYTLTLSWSDLVPPEVTKLRTAIALCAVNFQRLQLAGMKINHTDIVDPPEYVGTTFIDEAYATLQTGSAPSFEAVEGYRFYATNNSMYGPLLYKATLHLIVADYRYLQESLQ